jgi:pimeloyl-ACP methyl ester carboxylesterase
LAGQAGVPPLAGLCEPVTALVRADGRNPQLVFYRTRMDDDVIIGGREVELAADFSAPLAYMLSRGENRNMDVVSLLRSDRKFHRTGLYQFHRYDPEKIPVVFVHGLMSRPETWVPAVNELMADEEIRERYQFWFFLYPTGLPVWGSAAELRSEIDRYRKAFDPARRNRNFDRMVLAGHSMGGLISSLQVRTGGEKLWRQFMDTPPYQLSISPEMKERVVKIVNFQPRPEVARVVFFSTPHRGSELAVNPVAEFFSRLIRLPFSFIEKDRMTLQAAMYEQYRDLFVAPANSVVFLRANSPLLKSILALPMRPGVPYHSVIGDQGRGNTPDSSDGVVPYWSSHMKNAKSEKIVPSGHGSHEHPEGIVELRRILKLHL